MNTGTNEFTGEISAPFPSNFKIPHKTSKTVDNVQVNQINPMEYYPTEAPVVKQSPQKSPSADVVVVKKRKCDNGTPHFFYRPPSDESLPMELTKLMLPLRCELCSVTLNSTITAKTQRLAAGVVIAYGSADTQEREGLFFNNSRVAVATDDLNKMILGSILQLADGPSGPNAFHCELWDLPLTSLQHANQHYSGKRHRMTLAGRSTPHGSGYYGSDGKWIRTQTKATVVPTGRFNIGESFLNQQPPAEVKPSATTTTVASVPTETAQPTIEIDPDKYCKICNVSVTLQPQMKLHLEGSKHAKKLKAIGAPPYAPEGQDTILQSIDTKQVKSNSKKRDISIYRTPSGYFYCKPCDLTIPNEVLFNQHLDGKKHIKASANASKSS